MCSSFQGTRPIRICSSRDLTDTVIVSLKEGETAREGGRERGMQGERKEGRERKKTSSTKAYKKKGRI